MTARVGVIGTGMIGRDHIRRLSGVLSGARVTAVTDVDTAKAAEIGKAVSATVHATGQEVIADENVDAIIVTSWGPTHEEYVLAAIAAGKQVFCEKPLAETPDACLRIVEAETALGRKFVQVGYMRRYDAAYRALKRVLTTGTIGAALMMHCAHRNPSVPGHYTRDMAITDTSVHEIDVIRWLFAEEIVATRVLTPRPSANGGDLQDPLLILFELESGAIVDVEVSVNIRYGYDIRGEVVGENGTASLGEPAPVVVRTAGQVSAPVPADWRERFVLAYDVELQEWLDGVAAGRDPQGPSAWDGYAASAVSAAALAALNSGERIVIKLADKPDLYA